ncbi:MAG: peptidoglycan DD-metalloendopeptidase family protein [Longispora sp.]|nr:peptidoglycan DD-metalloendopeptidase family protein [Longispora sp. (in: high G+C Gram-positive bacteria)]
MYADPKEDLQKVNVQLAEANSILEGATERARGAAQAYAAATAALPEAVANIARSKGQAAAAAALAGQARADADEARNSFQKASVRYTTAAEVVDNERDKVTKFVIATYQGSSLMQVNAVLASNNPTDLADRLSYLDQVSQKNTAALNQLTATRLQERLKQNEADISREAAERAEFVAEATFKAAKQAEVGAVAAAQNAELLVGQQKQALTVAEQEKSASLARYVAVQAESERIAAQLRSQPPHAAAPMAYQGDYLQMPVRNAWKSSDYGKRFDPYYNVWQLHAGVDLAAGGGAPIYAAAAGKVVQASWNGGYGNYTCISHGKYNGRNIATCYAHQSAILVRSGQWVDAGQSIGRVGTTGASTGDHLHFEVRLNGSPAQPLDFLPPCLC